MKKIIIVRHGQTNANAEGKTQGQIDTDLNNIGLDQAKKAGQYIRANYSINEAWVSDLKRTQQTANQITKNFKTSELIREMSFGKWENHLFENIISEYPKLVKEYAEASESFRAPEGESFKDMHIRSVDFLKNINMKDKNELLIVSHGGFMRVLICSILDLPIKNLINFQFENCSITEIIKHENKKPILSKINYTDHLK
jgi:broad specificity phosphatase PhoE|tara:strand:+ start:325 stop:921 length:597 start_codon:yes stop_codon:yes gene_type:complete